MKRRVYNFFENGGPAVKRPKKYDDGQPKCLLLALPGELRNRIYDYCLIEEEIYVTRNTKPPALLSVCRRIREETQPIWFSDNVFVFNIYDCNASLLYFFQQQAMVSLRIPSLRKRFRRNLGHDIWTPRNGDGAHWDNLEQWCRDIHQGELHGIHADEEEFGDTDAVIYAAHGMARNAKNVKAPWQDCKEQLDLLRIVAGRLNPNWLD